MNDSLLIEHSIHTGFRVRGNKEQFVFSEKTIHSPDTLILGCHMSKSKFNLSAVTRVEFFIACSPSAHYYQVMVRT